MTRREFKRRLRAARHHARLLTDAGIPHHVKTDGHGFCYPIPDGTAKRTKGTSAEIRSRVVLQHIDAGRPKGKRTERYTTLHDFDGRHPRLSRGGGKK